MSLSVVARSALRPRQIAARGFKSSTPARSAGHGEYHVWTRTSLIDMLKRTHLMQHLPFQFPGNKRLKFGVKVTAYLLSGFSIPFLAAYHQLSVTSTELFQSFC
jgi:cytochrome c oxidase subunit 7c